jgi:hypothetical protein
MRLNSRARIKNNLQAAWKWSISFLKRDWEISDYPTALRKQEADPSYTSTRLEHYRYSASIVNWWTVTGLGDTEQEAFLNLDKSFARAKAERARTKKPLPRPGTRVPIEFASQDRVTAHAALAEDFTRRVLNVDWAWLSDESSLWDFHHAGTNEELIEKIKQVYGVDVSDVELARLSEILERIAAKQP